MNRTDPNQIFMACYHAPASLSRIFNSCASEKRSAVTAFNKKNNQSIWVFPKIMVHPNHPFVHRVFHYKPSIFGYHYFWKHPKKKCTQTKPSEVPNFANLLPQILQFLTMTGNTEAPLATSQDVHQIQVKDGKVLLYKCFYMSFNFNMTFSNHVQADETVKKVRKNRHSFKRPWGSWFSGLCNLTCEFIKKHSIIAGLLTSDLDMFFLYDLDFENLI